MGPDLNGRYCVWVAVEGTGQSDGKTRPAPRQLRRTVPRCCLSQAPQAQWRRSAFIFSAAQTRAVEGELPSCAAPRRAQSSLPLQQSLLFSKGRLTSPQRAYCLLHRSSLMQNNNLLIAYLSFKCPRPKQNRQLERPSCVGIAAWQQAHSLKPGYFYAIPPKQQ